MVKYDWLAGGFCRAVRRAVGGKSESWQKKRQELRSVIKKCGGPERYVVDKNVEEVIK